MDMKTCIVTTFALVLTTGVLADVCSDLANLVDREYDIEEINNCYECGWHKVTVDRRQPSESETDLFTEDNLFRVGNTGPAWCGSDDGGDYLEITFDRAMKIGGVVIQGAASEDSWVTSFQVSYDDGTGNFNFIKDEKGAKRFQGNSNARGTEERKFPVPVVTTAVRIHPITDHVAPCMKVDIYACKAADASLELGALLDVMRHEVNTLCTVNVLEDCGGLKCIGTKFKRDMFNCEMCECEEEMALGKFESDIDLSQMPHEVLEGAYETKKATTDPGEVFKAAGREGAIQKWLDYRQNGKVFIPYTTSSGLSSRAPAAIQSAIDHLAKYTCINLIRRSNQPYYINFRNSGGCSSPVGKYRGGNQVSIGYGCEHTGIVVHEILHSLGFWHEQSRPDRDSYVSIQLQNIRRGMAYNFQKRSTRDVDSLGSPYDLGSVMHYGATAFSNNGRPTIVARNGGTLGQRRGLSAEDIKQVNKMYGCDTTGGQTTKPTTRPTPGPTTTTRPSGNCRDQNRHCGYWARIGECDKNPRYMKVYCKKSCNVCGSQGCRDLNRNCRSWTRYCNASNYIAYMSTQCPKTCRKC